MVSQVEKMLKEIFKDFEFNSDIINTKIKSINLYKKQSKLEVNLLSEKPIKIKDVGAFEKYLVKRFLLKEACVKIDYSEGIKNDFQKQWNDIIDYLAYKHPLTKALLKNCTLNAENSVLEIKLQLSGSDMLYARKMDECLSEIIFNVFQEKYKIKYIDNNSEETKKQIEQYTEMLQTEVIKKVSEQAIQQEKERKENNNSENISNDTKKASNDSSNSKENINNVSNPNSNPNVQQEVQKQEKEDAEEITPLILGRNPNIKEPLTKVIDITIDSGKIALDGEIINTDSRELKSGKFLFMFDLYDGTSTITCKAFIEQEKFKNVSRKN